MNGGEATEGGKGGVKGEERRCVAPCVPRTCRSGKLAVILRPTSTL